MNDRQRRRFLGLGARTIAGAGLALGAHPLAGLARANARLPFSEIDAPLLNDASGDYRALVCVFLEGGSDGFSLIVPGGAAEYDAYQRSRGALALGSNQLLDLMPPSSEQGALSLHRAAEPLQPLFRDGRLAFMANIGNLVEPTSREQYEAGAVALPAQLFSHADQVVQWQQLQGRNRTRSGWGALAADHLANPNGADYLTSISLAGANAWQAGVGRRPFTLRSRGVESYAGVSSDSNWEQPRREAFASVLDAERSHVLEQAYASLQRQARDNTTALGAALEARFGDEDPATASVPYVEGGDSLAARLNRVAQVIALHEELGMRRQIFYVRLGGFDVHDNQSAEQPELFAELTTALASFQQAIDGFGLAENVTSFTASDFGRTLSSNGDGTDHGWGNHLFAMGGAVRGGRVYGTLPELDVDGADAVHNGRVLPTMAAVEYAASLLRWVGLDDRQVDEVLPTLANFPNRDLGFLA